jgi:hypothetical protein
MGPALRTGDNHLMSKLVLPIAYEEIVQNLGGSKNINAKLMEFVQPVEDAERDLAEVLGFMEHSGRLVFLHGRPGVGKSTFVQSLTWRTQLLVSHLEQFDATAYPVTESLDHALSAIRSLAATAAKKADLGAGVLVINYLENLDGVPVNTVRGFFRALNGLLRNNRVLVIWPVTSRQDVEKMLHEAAQVSGTLFHSGKDVIEFSGPATTAFPTIARNTIAVLNDGRLLEDFDLTNDDLDELLKRLQSQGQEQTTIRNYLRMLKESWIARSDQLSAIRATFPKHTEIWFVVAHKDAEEIADQFARKSPDPSEAWRASHGKLMEYIHNNQRAADWNAKRLQFAIGGAFTCRILYLPTSTLATTIAAFGDGTLLSRLQFNNLGLPRGWYKKDTARKRLATTPLLRQLRDETAKLGKRRSGTVATALTTAAPAYANMSRFASGDAGGSDEPLNHVLGAALRDMLGASYTVEVEQPHPWLPNIIPDIRVDTPSDRHVCIEMFYSARTDAYVAADYVLKKLDRYMRQLESKVGSTK